MHPCVSFGDCKRHQASPHLAWFVEANQAAVRPICVAQVVAYAAAAALSTLSLRGTGAWQGHLFVCLVTCCSFGMRHPCNILALHDTHTAGVVFVAAACIPFTIPAVLGCALGCRVNPGLAGPA